MGQKVIAVCITMREFSLRKPLECPDGTVNDRLFDVFYFFSFSAHLLWFYPMFVFTFVYILFESGECFKKLALKEYILILLNC